MDSAEPEVSVALTLVAKKMNPEGVQRVEELATSLGLKLTRTGRATLSFRAPASVVNEVFGVLPELRSPIGPGTADFGSPAGFVATNEPEVPEQLAEYVRAVSITPPPVRLSAPRHPDQEAHDGEEKDGEEDRGEKDGAEEEDHQG